MTQIKVKIPLVFRPLLCEKKRIKFCYGGRSGGKSYAFADSLLIKGRMEKLFIVCLREIQGSIKDSVHKLLSDRIDFYGLRDYKVTQNKIENLLTGTVFIFKGLRDQDPQKIKSLEGADIAWIEEAQTISKKSWDILEPTIRKPDSEIWISMNRETPTDPLWVALASKPDDNIWLQKINYVDNPFCPQEMIDLAQKTKQNNLADYQHIWLGEPLAQGDNKLISSALVYEAQRKKNIYQDKTPPLIIGLDIARFGDDESVFCFRRGRVCEPFVCLKKQDTISLAHQAIHFIETKHPKRLFLDIGGQGAGVYDVLIHQGYHKIVKGINFGAKAHFDKRYVNMRAQMWDSVQKWLANPLPVELPDDALLSDDLICVNKKYDSYGRLQLESKELIKRRLSRSPDRADALALTFAEPYLDETDGRNDESQEDFVSIESLFQGQNNHLNQW